MCVHISPMHTKTELRVNTYNNTLYVNVTDISVFIFDMKKGKRRRKVSVLHLTKTEMKNFRLESPPPPPPPSLRLGVRGPSRLPQWGPVLFKIPTF